MALGLWPTDVNRACVKKEEAPLLHWGCPGDPPHGIPHPRVQSWYFGLRDWKGWGSNLVITRMADGRGGTPWDRMGPRGTTWDHVGPRGTRGLSPPRVVAVIIG